MIQMTFRSLWARKRRLGGTAMAIVLGVGFLAATLVLGDTLDQSFKGYFTQANAGTDVVVRNASSIQTDEGEQREPISTELTAQVAQVPGVSGVAPEYRGLAQILDADGRPIGGQGPPTQGANWIADPVLNPYQVTDGRPPVRDGEVVLDRTSADTAGLQVGDTATIVTPEPVELTVVGLVQFGDQPTMLGATYAGLTDSQAATLFTEPGTMTELRVRGDEGTSAQDLAASIAADVGNDAETITGADLTAEEQARIEGDFLGLVKTSLLAFAAVALVVATFSIYNTFTIMVAQRGRESALLRAVGASRTQVLASILIEATVIGAVAAMVGLGVGLGLALGLKALMGATGLDLPGTGLTVMPAALGLSAAVGMVVTLVASIVPAVRSAGVAPIEALRESASNVSGPGRVRTGAGLVVGGIGGWVVLSATESPDGAFARAGLGALLVIVAVIVLGPALAHPAASVIGAPVAKLRGQPGRLARRNAMRNPRRTSASALALVIGTTVVALFATFGASLRMSIDQTVERSFGGDFVLTQDGFSGVAINPDIAPAVEALDEVDQVAGLQEVITTIDGTVEYPTAADPAALVALVDLDVREGSVADLGSGQLAITDGYADDHGLVLGDDVTINHLDGTETTANIGAIYAVRELLGDIVMPIEDWRPHASDAGDAAVLIGLRDGTSLPEGREVVQATVDGLAGPTVMDRDQYIDAVAGEIDTLLTLVYVMLVLAVLIALMGLANTLSLSIHERTRELGMLRAVGMSRSGLRATVRWESVITAVLGAGIGMVLGTFGGWGLIRALAAQEGFISFDAPVSTLIVVVVGAAAAGVLAAVRPARRAGRLDIIASMADQ